MEEKKKAHSSQKREGLRFRAEDAFEKRLDKFKDLSIKDRDELIHELSVYHIELEMQNDELRKAQERIEQDREKYIDLFDFAPLGYFILDKNFIILDVNLTGAQLLGLARGLLKQKAFTLFIHRDDQDTFYLHARKVLESKTGQNCEIKLSEEKGLNRLVQLDSMALVDEKGDGPCLRIAMTDITERREMEAQLESQKHMAIVGQLAAGMAHQFNNILQAMMGHAELIILQEDLSEEAKKDLETILNQGRRAADIMGQILDFSGKSFSRKTRLDLSVLLEGEMKLFQKTLPQSIEVEVSIEPGEFWVHGDPLHFQQILNSLVSNSFDAMEGKGRLMVGFRRADPGVAGSSKESLEPVRCMVLSVTDTGTGVSPEVLPHIFEPFFTTKSQGKGTGLGLAQVYGLVKQQSGWIEVKSEEGKGSTFLVYLPLVK